MMKIEKVDKSSSAGNAVDSDSTAQDISVCQPIRQTQCYAPFILDACCGSRMFWFNNEDERVLYVDIREGEKAMDVGTPNTKGRKPKIVKPDVISDFRQMPFADNSFYHVVFDPPHFHKGAGENGIIAFKYGLLKDTWKDDIKKGFAECFRVLKPFGTLIFKWCEVEIPLKEILSLTDEKPLYGHRSGKKAMTHWVAFVKNGA